MPKSKRPDLALLAPPTGGADVRREGRWRAVAEDEIAWVVLVEDRDPLGRTAVHGPFGDEVEAEEFTAELRSSLLQARVTRLLSPAEVPTGNS